MDQKHSVSELNALSRDEFVHLVGPVFEHSPWFAGETWEKRPFSGLEELYGRLCETVRTAGDEKQLVLIRAHPDLVGKVALAGKLTTASNAEQVGAGLNRL